MAYVLNNELFVIFAIVIIIKNTKNMKKLLSISFFMIFVFGTCCVFAQKPTKPTKQVTQVQNTVKPSNLHVGQTSNTPACWTITGKNGDVEYRWDTEANVIRWINEMRTQHNEIYAYTRSTANDVNACDAKNEKLNPKKCWKITASKNGQGIEQYLWATETVARRKVESLKGEGYQQAIYVETPANDEKSCNASSSTSSSEPGCWKIKIGNTISYYWGYQQDAQEMVNSAINSGQSASLEPSDLTKDSCIEKQ